MQNECLGSDLSLHSCLGYPKSRFTSIYGTRLEEGAHRRLGFKSHQVHFLSSTHDSQQLEASVPATVPATPEPNRLVSVVSLLETDSWKLEYKDDKKRYFLQMITARLSMTMNFQPDGVLDGGDVASIDVPSFQAMQPCFTGMTRGEDKSPRCNAGILMSFFTNTIRGSTAYLPTVIFRISSPPGRPKRRVAPRTRQ